MNRRAGMLLFALLSALLASRADADEPPSEHRDMSEGSFLPPAVAYGGLCLVVALGAGLALRRRSAREAV
jgi:hypothetical protein